MSVVATDLESNITSADDDDYTTGSVSVSTGDLVLLGVGYDSAGGTPTPSGLGLTWEIVDTVTQASNRVIRLFRAEAASGATGTVNITFGGTSTWCGWTIAKVTGHDPGGNGADALETIDTNTGANTTTFSLDLSGARPGVTIGFSVHDTNNSNTVVTGDTWANLSIGGPLGRYGSGQDPTGAGTFTFTSSGNRNWGGVGVRVVEPADEEPAEGSVSGSVSWTGTVTGTRESAGSVTGSVAWAGAVTGEALHAGSVSGSVTWVGEVTGEAPEVDGASGSVSGSITWAGAVTGERDSLGTVTGAVAWVGTVTGQAEHAGSVSGSIGWAGTVTGEAPAIGDNTGEVVGIITWAGTVTGARQSAGSVAGTVTWVGTVNGVNGEGGPFPVGRITVTVSTVDATVTVSTVQPAVTVTPIGAP